ncbi:hypothetical protein [Chamaesiphon sp. OTE_8_metabat_110]|uniref:hypothetical protein n=1 Tax=Chamaesiphon sp. OTE_8_metabat_110 TaxID=2964696 RepID=UPI00286A1779|nr:hypothetical protein [Chamaesiphon sp. OTE_8_metabat_110]
MPCEFLSGLIQLALSQSDITIAPGGTLPTGAIYLFLSARNRAGWTKASSGLLVNIPALSRLTITLNEIANRGLGTDFIRYSLSANTTSNPQSAVQIAEWENYNADTYTRRTLNPIVLSRPEHVQLASSVATINDLPSGSDLINGMHRLVIGAAPSGYYKYSSYASTPWARVDSPYTCQILDPYGTAGAAADVGSIDPNYLILPPAYDVVRPDPVAGVPAKLVWRNNNPYDLPTGTEFAILVEQGSRDRTSSFEGKLIVTFKGYTDGLGNLDRLALSGLTTMPYVDGDRIWSTDAAGIMLLHKPLPPGECAVWEIAPFFNAAQFSGQLVPGESVDIYIYPLPASGKNVAALWSVTGDTILPVGERLHPVPKLGAGIKIGSGAAIVKSYVPSIRSEQTIYGLSSNTPNQKLTIDGNGVVRLTANPLATEAILAIVSTVAGTSKLGTLSPALNVVAGGKVNLTLTYLGYAGDENCSIRSSYPVIGGDVGEFNPNFVRIFAKLGTIVYPALSAGNAQTGVIPDPTQSLTIDSLGAPVQIQDPADPLFGLFDPPTLTGTPTTGGSIPAGSYQFFAVYYYDGSTASAIDRISPTVIGESELTLAELSDLNQGWGRPIYNLSDLRSIDRTDTFAWQHRPVNGGSIFYYDPNSLEIDDGISTFKPSYLTTAQPGRWLIRKSYSINPRGIHSLTATYSYLDRVTVVDVGAYLYINPVPSTGQPLTNATYWLQDTYRGSQGIQGIPGLTGAITVGTNPVSPALNDSATYTVDSIQGLAIGQYYAFNGVAGTLLLTALPTLTTVTLQNTDATVGSTISAGTKLLATGKTGGIGQTGAAGTVGATTSGTNPVTPALNATITITVDAVGGLSVGQYYKFSGIAGTFFSTALPTPTTVTLQNIDATVGAAIGSGTRLNLSGQRGAIGLSGSPHIARGDYVGTATYSQYDEIYHPPTGASYWWISPTPGNTAPPSANWQKIADKGDPGAVGLPGTTGATIAGVNPVTPAIGATASYFVDSTLNLAVGQYYAFGGVAGTFLLTALPTPTTVTLQNTDATVGAAVGNGTKLTATGKTGATGVGQAGATGSVTATSGINILEQASAPTSASNTLKVFADTNGNLSLVASTEDGGQIRELTRSRKTTTITTSSIGNGLSAVGTIALAPAFLLHSISSTANARIRIYQTAAQLTADAARASTTAPVGNHGLIFEAIGSGVIPTQFGVVGANKEASLTANLPISIVNQSGSNNSFTLTASFTPLES